MSRPSVRCFAVTAVLVSFVACGPSPHAEIKPASKTPGDAGSSSAPSMASSPLSDVRIAVGGASACAVIKGRVLCWGRGAQGVLGNGSDRSSAVPVPVQGIDDAIDVTVSSYAHACALHRDGGVSCWGVNDSGQLGDGTRDEKHVPIRVPGLANVGQVSAGTSHTCAVLKDESVRCWGRNHMAQLGDGTWDDRPSLITVPGVRASRVGSSANRTCALVTSAPPPLAGTSTTSPSTSRGTSLGASDLPLLCWGGGHQTSGYATAPALVREIPPGRSLSVSNGFDLACVLVANGEVHCWPNNQQHPKVIVVPGIGDAVDVSVGGTGACALRGAVARSVSCWDYRLTPEAVPNLASAARIAQGNGWGCAVRPNGRVACWGNAGEGQLGDGSVQRVTEPTRVMDLDGPVDALTTGAHHTCARIAGPAGMSDVVRCWGLNRSRELGDGTTIDHATATTSLNAKRANEMSRSEPARANETSARANETSARVNETRARLIAGHGVTCTLHGTSLRCWGATRSSDKTVSGDDSGAESTRDNVWDTAKDVYAAAAYGAAFCVVQKQSGAVGVRCAKETGDPRSLREVPGLVGQVDQLAVSSLGVCALRSGRVTCAGFPYHGPIRGLPLLIPEKATLVAGIADAVEIALAGYHLIARLKSGAVVGVAVGGGDVQSSSSTKEKPSPRGGPPAINDAVAIAAFGEDRFCAVRSNGLVVCAAPYPSPADAPQTFDIGASRTIAGGPHHICVALKAGGAMCWGDSTYGQVGGGSFGYRAAAADITLVP